VKVYVPFFFVLLFAVTALAVDFPQIEGWERESDITTYNTETLWEFINGAAETFMQYGFQEVKTAELSRAGTTVAVSIYDMGSPLDAYGVYRTEVPEGETALAIGAQAIVSAPYQCLMAKDRYYVKVDVYQGEIDAAAGRAMLGDIAAALPGSDGMPKAFDMLPSAARKSGSERWTHTAYLGLKELGRCVSADYEGGFTIFVVLPSPHMKDEAFWASLARSWKAVPVDGAAVLTKTVPYTGVVGVIRTSRGIFGVVGATSETTLIEELERLQETSN